MARTSTSFKRGDGRARMAGSRGGRNKPPDDVVALARQSTVTAIMRLRDILEDPASPPAAVIRAAEALLDRAWGKAPQSIKMDGQGSHFKRIVFEVVTPLADPVKAAELSAAQAAK